MFDPAPLLALFTAMAADRPHWSNADEVLAQRAGVSARTIDRWRSGTMVKGATADRVACALGRHPGEIWPEWWAVE